MVVQNSKNTKSIFQTLTFKVKDHKMIKPTRWSGFYIQKIILFSCNLGSELYSGLPKFVVTE